MRRISLIAIVKRRSEWIKAGGIGYSNGKSLQCGQLECAPYPVIRGPAARGTGGPQLGSRRHTAPACSGLIKEHVPAAFFSGWDRKCRECGTSAPSLAAAAGAATGWGAGSQFPGSDKFANRLFSQQTAGKIMGAGLSVRVQKEAFDPGAEAARLTEGRASIGAVVTFVGLCRDEGGALAALEIEHYPGMAEKELRRVAGEAAARWPIEGIIVIHRFGIIRPGEPIVFAATAATHRAEAFAAASFLMDYLKTEAPFWKKLHFLSGPGDWVATKQEDEAAAQRWRG